MNKGTGEQMVDLERVTDDPGAKLANLNAAIARNKQDATLYSRRATVFLQNGQTDKALADAEEAIRLNKSDMAHLFLKAQVLRAMGKPKEALAVALQAERNSYQTASMYILLSDLYLKLDQPVKAADYTKRALELSPKNAHALYYNGRVLLANGDTTRAVLNYRKALTESPDFGEARRDITGALISLKQYEEAGLHLDQVLKQMPTESILWHYKGELYQISQKPDSALWSYNKAIMLNDTLQPAQYQAGMLLFSRGQYDAAIIHLEKAADTYKKEVKFVTTLAAAYERTGQYIKALEQYQRLVAMHPEQTYAYQSIARLKAKLMRPAPVVADTANLIE